MPLTPPQHDNNVVINMGGTVISIASETPLDPISPSDPFYRFLCSEPPQVNVTCRNAGCSKLRLPTHGLLYADGDAFKVYSHNGNVILAFG
jgi:hypothetical protein